MDKKVIVAGHICLDITPVFKGDPKNKVSEVLMPGKLVEAGAASVSTGGVVANTGLAMKLLGADVRLMGKIGTDEFGDMICAILDRHGAKADMIRDEKEPTSYSVVLAIPGIDRMFIHCPGTNNTYCADDIPDDTLKDIALFHFGYPPLMKRMYEDSGSELVALFKKVKDAGCATSLDLAAVDPKSEAGQADWEGILKRVIPYVDFFVPSVEELCFMIDPQRYDEWQERAGDGDITEVLDLDNDIRPLADKCMTFGTKVLLLKCGAKGLYYRTAPMDDISRMPDKLGLDAALWAKKEGFERSFRPDEVLSATGAGDTSIAAFLTAMLNGCPVEECVQLAAATGACCVSAYDALSGLKPLAELREKIENGWEKN